MSSGSQVRDSSVSLAALMARVAGQAVQESPELTEKCACIVASRALSQGALWSCRRGTGVKGRALGIRIPGMPLNRASRGVATECYAELGSCEGFRMS